MIRGYCSFMIWFCGTVAFAEVTFEKKTLSERFVAEGCAVADFDKDGHADITAGNTIWHGPDFSRTTEFTPPANNPSGPSKTPYDPARGYSDYFLAYAHDFTGDGWQDILVYALPGEPAHVFVNPQGRVGHWEKHVIFDVADGESPGLVDMTGDGKPELLAHSSDLVKPPEAHGYGAGDVNGDGRMDLLTREGWFEQPADATAAIWPFHPGPFGPADAQGGAQMLVTDANGDGRNDVVTSYNAHGCGLGWFEQRPDGSFAEHRIMGAAPEENEQRVTFSQLHALALADIDGDGLQDVVTGKRRWAHGITGDIDPNASPVLYWFRLERDGSGGARYVAQKIDDDSGVGTQVTVADLNGDKKSDVVVANKRGVFAFTQQ